MKQEDFLRLQHGVRTPMWCSGGLHLGSIYLRCTEGLTPENLDILQQAAGALNSVLGEWIIGGDFNSDPTL